MNQYSEELKKLDLTAERKQKLLDLEQRIVDVQSKQNLPTVEAGAEELAKVQDACAKMQTALSGLGREQAALMIQVPNQSQNNTAIPITSDRAQRFYI